MLAERKERTRRKNRRIKWRKELAPIREGEAEMESEDGGPPDPLPNWEEREAGGRELATFYQSPALGGEAELSAGPSSALRSQGREELRSLRQPRRPLRSRSEEEAWMLRQVEAGLAFERLSRAHRASVALLALAFLSSILTALCLSQVNYSGDILSCVIQAKWELGHESLATAMKRHNVSANATEEPPEPQDEDAMRWIVEDVQVGARTTCHLLHFGHAASAILAALTLWFLCLFRPSRKDLERRVDLPAAKIVPFALLASLVCFALCLAASINLELGLGKFCGHMLGQGIIDACGEVNRFALWRGSRLDPPLRQSNFYQLLTASEVLTWLSVVWWLGAGLLTAWRVKAHLDFPSYYFQPLSVKERTLRNKFSTSG